MYIIKGIREIGTTTLITDTSLEVALSTNDGTKESWLNATLTEDDTTKRYIITNSDGDEVWKSAYEETALMFTYESVAEPEPEPEP